MNYIIFDLEWNQSPTGKEDENKDIPFEIIEIGAVKLDSNKNIVSKFSEFVKPQVYDEMHFITQEIIHIRMEELVLGKPFVEVVNDFFEWCGEDYTFCTWGSMDLTEIQRNMSFYNMEKLDDKPIKYYNIQKMFGILFDEDQQWRNLEYAIDYLKIEKNNQFHRAYSDALYTALILQKIDLELLEENYSLDYYNNPKSKDEEVYVNFDNYTKYVSREFKSKVEALSDMEVTSTQCYKCNKNTVKKVAWFLGSPSSYFSLSFCNEHGYLRGKIRIKKSFEGKTYVVKTLKLISEEEASKIFMRKDDIRVRRRRKRINKKIRKASAK